jgi:hypothetical protein
MGGVWDKVIVGVLVAAAGAWALRALVRSLRRPGKCSSCASGGNCPLASQAAARTGGHVEPEPIDLCAPRNPAK